MKLYSLGFSFWHPVLNSIRLLFFEPVIFLGSPPGFLSSYEMFVLYRHVERRTRGLGWTHILLLRAHFTRQPLYCYKILQVLHERWKMKRQTNLNQNLQKYSDFPWEGKPEIMLTRVAISGMCFSVKVVLFFFSFFGILWKLAEYSKSSFP